jgi:hypothetical protein
MIDSPKWMPVFLVQEAHRSVDLNLSTEGKVLHHKTTDKGKSQWSRIGTARSRPDGGFTIRLNALPLNGTLVMRPPLPGEYSDPSKSST